jgi:hypothetical protein
VLESSQPPAEVTEPAEVIEPPRTIAEEYKTELEALLARWDDGRILTIVDSRIESQMSTLESQLGILMQNADASFLYMKRWFFFTKISSGQHSRKLCTLVWCATGRLRASAQTSMAELAEACEETQSKIAATNEREGEAESGTGAGEIAAQVGDLSARLDALKQWSESSSSRFSDELGSLREETSDLRDETSDIRESMASPEPAVSALPPSPQHSADARHPSPPSPAAAAASKPRGRRYSVSMAPGAAQDAVANLEGDMNQFEEKLTALRALEQRMEHNLEMHREDLAKQRMLNEGSAESVGSLERKQRATGIRVDALAARLRDVERAGQEVAAAAAAEDVGTEASSLSEAATSELTKGIMSQVESQVAAVEAKFKADLGEVVELNMEAEEELRADMAAVVKEAKAAAEVGAGGAVQGEVSLMDELEPALRSSSSSSLAAGIDSAAAADATSDAVTTAAAADVEALVQGQIAEHCLVSKDEYRADLKKLRGVLSTEMGEKLTEVNEQLADSSEEAIILAKRVTELVQRVDGLAAAAAGNQQPAVVGDGGGSGPGSSPRAANAGGGSAGESSSATQKLKSLRRKK